MTQTATVPVKPSGPLNQWGVPPCPECGRDNFKAKTALGAHRSREHNVKGASLSAIANRRKNGTERRLGRPPKTLSPSQAPSFSPDAKICTICDPPSREFASPNGLKIHLSQVHNIGGTSSTARSKAAKQSTELVLTSPQKVAKHVANGHSSQDATYSQLTNEDLLIFKTVGEITTHCRFVAESAGFITPLFTARVLAALQHTKGR